MIRALVSGVLTTRRSRTGQNGKPFTTAKVRAEGKDGAARLVQHHRFRRTAERLATLKPERH